MAATDLIFTGLWHQAGNTVSVSIAGLDCGNFVVGDSGASYGSITVPLASDPDGLLGYPYLSGISAASFSAAQDAWGDSATAVYIWNGSANVWVYVPVVIGATFTSAGQLMRPAAEGQIKSPRGPRGARKGRAHQYGLLLANASGISVGTSSSVLYNVPRPGSDTLTALPASTPFTGWTWDTLSDDYSLNNSLYWQVNRPYACTVMAAQVFFDVAEK